MGHNCVRVGCFLSKTIDAYYDHLIVVCPTKVCIFQPTCCYVSLFTQWAAIACVGAVLNNSVLQLLIFCVIHVVSFVILVVLRPFANR